MRKTLDRSSFGDLLREFRLAAQLSQETLAERAAMSADGISALERGVNKAPQKQTLEAIVGALQLQPDQRHAIEVAAKRPPVARRPRSHAPRGHNLPRLGSPLFGREEEVTELLELLEKAQVLTLTGAGGVGKTRLAVEVGYRALGGVEDGAWFVDLSALRDPNAVPAAVAAVFGVRASANQPLVDAIAEALRRKRLLVILDNCEQVAAGAAALVERIAAECPRVRILATSRQPLAIAGEQTYRLASLSVDASVELFAETARRADVSFSLDDERPSVERICRRLDGIALAIELAAAHVRLLGVAEIEELLSQRFAALSDGARLARHQTMRALIDWSYELLSSQERLLFARLAVFPGDFSLDAVLNIGAGADVPRSRVLDLLGSLVDKSLVVSERKGKARRFRLLETIRAYASEKSDAERSELCGRHAQYYLQLVESHDSRAPEWNEALDAEHDNLLRALEWAIDENGNAALGVRLLTAMRDYLLYGGLSADSARRAELALTGAGLTKPLAAMAWETVAAMRGDLLMPSAALEATSHALELYEELNDIAGFARSLRRRGVALLRLGKFAEADADLQKALTLSREHGDVRDVARTLGSIAVGLEMGGRPREGHKALLEALEMSRREGDERLIGVTLINLAEAEFALGDIEAAKSRLEELLSSRAAQKNVRLRANTKANLAAYLLALHRDAEARTTARAAVLEARDAGDTGIVACAIQHLAATIANADPRAAAKLLGYVEAVFAANYRRENTERFTLDLLLASLRDALAQDQIDSLGREGATMNERQAVRLATRARAGD